MNNSSEEDVEMSGRGPGDLCDLTQSYSFILQSVLGVLAFSTLLLKRYCEPAVSRRPFSGYGIIALADTTKQALGMLEIHFLNLFLSSLISGQECIVYLVSFLLDSTAGLLIIYLLLKAVAWLVSVFELAPLKSGMYGTPFKIHYWLAQTSVYLAVIFLEKLIVGPLVAFSFWKKVQKVILPWHNEQLKIAIVIFIVPFIVNVIMFWIVDNLLMWKNKLLRDKPSVSVHYHRHSHSPFPPSASTLPSRKHSYHKLCSSDSETTRNDSNPVYIDSDFSECGEVHLERTELTTPS